METQLQTTRKGKIQQNEGERNKCEKDERQRRAQRERDGETEEWRDGGYRSRGGRRGQQWSQPAQAFEVCVYVLLLDVCLRTWLCVSVCVISCVHGVWSVHVCVSAFVSYLPCTINLDHPESLSLSLSSPPASTDKSLSLGFVPGGVCVCVCVCVWERERDINCDKCSKIIKSQTAKRPCWSPGMFGDKNCTKNQERQMDMHWVLWQGDPSVCP